MLTKGLSLVHLVTCSELRAAMCTTVGITSEEEDSEALSGIRIPKNGSLSFVEEGETVDSACCGATTSTIRAMNSGAGRSTIVRVQIPKNNLDNMHSSREKDGTLEAVDPHDLLSSFLLTDTDLITLDLLTGSVVLDFLGFLE
nr:hypothetical protein [Tanacetum cinerariifolium]